MAGAAAQVEHRVGHAVLEVVERFEQPRLDLALQRRRSFIRARRARERAPHLARIEHGAHGSSRRKPSSSAATSSAWVRNGAWPPCRSEEHTSELQSLMRISYAVFCLKKKKKTDKRHIETQMQRRRKK